MAYSEDGRKSRSTSKKRVTKYKASKGADFNDDTVRSIKTKTKYGKEGEIKKIKRVKKTEGGGKMVTISKLGLENNSLSPEGSIGLVTARQRENKKMKKELGPMAKLHDGPYNKAVGGINSTGPAAMSKISKNIPPKSDTIRVSNKYKPGDFVEEYELEKEIKKQTGAFPQLSVQDYSKVKVDDRGGNIVVKLEKGPQATRLPRGTKEEMAERKREKRNERVKNRLHKNALKKFKKSSRVQSKLDDGRITEALADQKQRKIFKYNEKKDNRKRFNYNR